MGGEGRSLGRARPSITSTSTAIAEHEYEYEYEWKVRASQLSFLCVLCFLLFVLFFVFALASIVPWLSRWAGDRDVPCNDECRKSNDERSPKSQIDASPTALARDCQLSNANCQLPTANCQLTR